MKLPNGPSWGHVHRLPTAYTATLLKQHFPLTIFSYRTENAQILHSKPQSVNAVPGNNLCYF
jgi:hypothetical protein